MLVTLLTCLLVIAGSSCGLIQEIDAGIRFTSLSSKPLSQSSNTQKKNSRIGPGPIDPDKPGGPRAKKHHRKHRKHHKKS
jgi:hypothetical protein